MARYRFKGGRTKPWMASVRNDDGTEKHIGYFRTEEEALCAEYDHGRRLPRGMICTCHICAVKPRG